MWKQQQPKSCCNLSDCYWPVFLQGLDWHGIVIDLFFWALYCILEQNSFDLSLKRWKAFYIMSGPVKSEDRVIFDNIDTKQKRLKPIATFDLWHKCLIFCIFELPLCGHRKVHQTWYCNEHCMFLTLTVSICIVQNNLFISFFLANGHVKSK